MTQAKFDPKQHLIQLKSKQGSQEYLPVQWRLVWLREACPDAQIETEIVHLDLDKEMEEETFVWNQDKRRSEKVIKSAKGVAIVRATVKDGRGGVATGTKMEKAVSFPDFLEKAETGAIGRALAALGYGTQFAPDLDEGERIADSPVTRSNAPQQEQTGTPTSPLTKPILAPVQSQPEAFQLETKSRVDALYRRAGKLGLFEHVPGDSKTTTANFFGWVSKIIGATITSSGQLTGSRLEKVEATVSAKEQASLIQEQPEAETEQAA